MAEDDLCDLEEGRGPPVFANIHGGVDIPDDMIPGAWRNGGKPARPTGTP